MAEGKPTPAFNAPIPGMSLTTEPGNRPWEKPPMMTSVEDAISFHMERLMDSENMADILDLIEEGLPITAMANTFQTLAVAKGVHTLDVGILVSPVIVEAMKAMAEDAEVEYVLGTEKQLTGKNKLRAIDQRAISEVLYEEDGDEEMPDSEMMDEMPEEEDEAMEERKGLMARKGGTEDGV